MKAGSFSPSFQNAERKQLLAASFFHIHIYRARSCQNATALAAATLSESTP